MFRSMARLGPSPIASAAAFVCGCTVICGCTVSPQPTPPPEIDVAALALSETPGRITLDGAAGAIVRGDDIGLLNASPFSAFERAPVASDGSFSVAIDGTVDDPFRLHAFAGTARSAPLDFIVVAGGVVAAPQIDCVVLSGGAQIDTTAGDVVVTLTNNCADAVQIDSAELALELTDWTLTPTIAMPTIADPASTTAFTVAFAPTSAGLQEQFLLFGLTLGEPFVHVVSFFGQN